MTGYNHTLAGALIAVALPTPLTPIAAFASHFLLDAFPHFGNSDRFALGTPAFRRLLLLDGALCIFSLAFAIWLFPHLWWLIALCAFLSALPDFMWLLWRGKVRSLEWFFRFSSWIQWGERPWAYPLELFYAAIFTGWLLLLS